MRINFERFFSSCFLLISATLVGLLLAEYLSRKFIPMAPSFGQPQGFDIEKVPRPYVMFGGNPKLPGINQLGYKGKQPTRKKKSGVKRIFVLGGSTTYNGDPTIPELIEYFLVHEGKFKAEVFNFGIPSAKSGEELARFLYEVLDYEPDMVLFYDGGNDLSEPFGDPRVGYPFNFFAMEFNPLFARTLEDYPALPLFIYGSHIMRHLFRPYFAERFFELNRLYEEAQKGSLPWIEKITDNYLKNIYKAHLLAKGAGVSFYVFFQPMRDFRDYFLTTGDHRPPANATWQTPHITPTLLAREALLKKVVPLRKKGLFFFDISNIYNEVKGEVFTDWVHTRQEFKPIVARKIYETIKVAL